MDWIRAGLNLLVIMKGNPKPGCRLEFIEDTCVDLSQISQDAVVFESEDGLHIFSWRSVGVEPQRFLQL